MAFDMTKCVKFFHNANNNTITIITTHFMHGNAQPISYLSDKMFILEQGASEEFNNGSENKITIKKERKKERMKAMN